MLRKKGKPDPTPARAQKRTTSAPRVPCSPDPEVSLAVPSPSPATGGPDVTSVFARKTRTAWLHCSSASSSAILVRSRPRVAGASWSLLRRLHRGFLLASTLRAVLGQACLDAVLAPPALHVRAIATSRRTVSSFLSQQPRKDCNRFPSELSARTISRAWSAFGRLASRRARRRRRLSNCVAAGRSPDSMLSAPWLVVRKAPVVCSLLLVHERGCRPLSTTTPPRRGCRLDACRLNSSSVSL